MSQKNNHHVDRSQRGGKKESSNEAKFKLLPLILRSNKYIMNQIPRMSNFLKKIYNT